MDKETFVKTINNMRRYNRNNWYWWDGVVEGKAISIKGYATWLQRYTVDGVHNGGAMDISVAEFNRELLHPFID